jgi:aminomethyltransferase
MTRRSPLHDLHAGLGARFVDFGGWEMPLQYNSVITEHQAVRAGCGVFDVSHLGRFRLISGDHALSRLVCNDHTLLAPGGTQYTMALNETGGVIDDIIVWRFEDGETWVLPNAANHERVMEGFVAEGAEIEDLRPATVSLAVQGPAAPDVLAAVLGDKPRRFRTQRARFGGSPAWVAGTGYTGERGGEVVVAAGDARGVMSALLEAGATPCGLGARDTLRLEAGLPLWGQDIDETITPLEAGLGFAVSFTHDFVGRAALERQRKDGPPRRRLCFRTEGRVIPRTGYPVSGQGGDGIVTSGNFSPVLGCGIGMALVDAGAGEPFAVEVRGVWHPVTPVDPPFVG